MQDAPQPSNPTEQPPEQPPEQPGAQPSQQPGQEHEPSGPSAQAVQPPARSGAAPPSVEQPVLDAEAEVESPVVLLTGEAASAAPAETSTPGSEAAAPEATRETVTGAPSDTSHPALSWIDFFKPEGIPYAAVVLILMGFLARFVSRECERLGNRFADRRLVIQQTGSFMRFFIYLLGLSFVVMTLFELTEQMMLAIGGSIAVAAGFALKDLVASLLAGIIILVDRPFQVGDRVTFAGYYGEVTHIGLRSVRLMTIDDTQVTIPNNIFLTEAVASGNAGAVDMMISVRLHIGIDQDLPEARRLLSEVVTTSRYVNLNRRWGVLTTQEMQESYLAIRLTAIAYVLDARLEGAFRSDITTRAMEAFNAAGIGPPVALGRDVPAPAAAS